MPNFSIADSLLSAAFGNRSLSARARTGVRLQATATGTLGGVIPFLFFLTCLFLSSLQLSAQVNATGTLLGTVSDKTGAVVPGADVKALDKLSGSLRLRSVTVG